MQRKRADGEGTLRQRSNGTWECSIMDGYQANGKRKYKSFYGKTQKEVKEKAQAWRTAKAGGLDLEHNYTFSDWADIWFESHKANISPTTQENYKYTLKALKGAFPNRLLTDIKAYDVEQMLKDFEEAGRSSSALSQYRGMLYQIMNKAEANDLIHKNPVRYAEKTRQKEPTERKEAFTAFEVTELMQKLPDDRMGWSIRLMLGTGMRTQELLALEPRLIEEDGSVIHIQQAVKMVKGTVQIGAPKSLDSYRDVPVPETVRWCAVKLRATDKQFVWEVKKPGSPCDPKYFRTKYKQALEAIPAVRVLTPHSCRHTFVSQLQSLGVDLSTIQSIVGHAEVDMTQHYLHVQAPIRQSAIARFSEAFPTAVPDEASNDSGTE